MRTALPSSSVSTRVFSSWLLASAVLGAVDAGVTFFGLPLPAVLARALAASLWLGVLGAPILWWLGIRPTGASTTTDQILPGGQQPLLELIDNLPAMVARFDSEQRCVFANQRALQIQGLTQHQTAGRRLSDALPAEAYALYAQHIPIVMSGQRTAFEGVGMRDGKPAHYLVTLIPERDHRGVVNGFFLMTSDITAVKLAQSEVRRSEARLRAITDNLPVLICSIDPQGLLQFVNRTFETSTGVPAETAVGRPFREVIGETSYLQAQDAIVNCLLGERTRFEVAIDLEGARKYWQGLCVPDIDSQGVVSCAYALLTDITSLRKSELNMTALALTDALTGLPNRRRLAEQLPEALANARRLNLGAALMFLDMDHFKRINDQHGHATGDAVLAEFARRLRGAVRASDCVARYAGDEFVVILDGVRTRQYGEQVAAAIVNAMREPFSVGELTLNVTTSVGVAYLVPGGLAEAQDLLDAADSALYQAKERGRDRFATREIGSASGSPPAVETAARPG